MSALLDLVRQRKAELLAAAEKPRAELKDLSPQGDKLPKAEGEPIDEAAIYDLPPPVVDVAADTPAETPKGAKAVDPLFDFSDEAAAIAELQRRLIGLPAAEGFALVDQWERRQRASIWEKIGYKPPRSDGFHGPLRCREISVA